MSARHALVMFSGHADLWWLRLLKPGFRHCFVAVEAESGWLVVEPLSHHTEFSLLPPMARRDLAQWYRGNGLTVVMALAVTPPRRVAPIRPYSCVESVKRFLGIQAGNVLTPWQLFRHIEQNMKIIVDIEAG
jgi:hypothetical protein